MRQRYKVEGEVKKIKLKINDFVKRVGNLLSTCPDSIKDIYLDIGSQFKDKEALTFIENGHCSHCRFTINSSTQSLIESGKALEACPSCGRLLIPRAARATV